MLYYRYQLRRNGKFWLHAPARISTREMVAPNFGADFFGAEFGAWGGDGGRLSPRGVVTAW